MRKWKSKSGFKTKSEANREGVKAYNEYIQTGQSFVPTKISYSEYLDYWIENYCKIAFRYRTVEEYSVIADKYLKRDLGHYRLNTITSYLLNSYLIDICNRYNYSYGYFRNFVKVIKCSFRIATDVYGFIKYNPSLTIELPRTINLKKDSRTCIYTRRDRPYIK